MTTNTPIIGYQNLATADNSTFSAGVAGYDGAKCLNPLTYEGWKPMLPANCVLDLGTASSVDYFAIAGRGMVGMTVTPSYSLDNVTWTTLTGVTLTQNVWMHTFTAVTARYWRFDLTGAIPTPLIISAYVGKALIMPHRIYGGHTPAVLARQSVIRPTTSEGGQWLGRTVIRQAYQTQVEFKHLHADWYRDNFDPFVISARDNPFFISWRPETHANEVVYAWTEKDIIPSNTGKLDYMQVGFNFIGWGG